MLYHQQSRFAEEEPGYSKRSLLHFAWDWMPVSMWCFHIPLGGAVSHWWHSLNLLAEQCGRRDKGTVSCPPQTRKHTRNHVLHSCEGLVKYLLMVLWIWVGKGGVKRKITSSLELPIPFKDRWATMKPEFYNNSFRRNTAPNFIHSENVLNTREAQGKRRQVLKKKVLLPSCPPVFSWDPGKGWVEGQSSSLIQWLGHTCHLGEMMIRNLAGHFSVTTNCSAHLDMTVWSRFQQTILI